MPAEGGKTNFPKCHKVAIDMKTVETDTPTSTYRPCCAVNVLDAWVGGGRTLYACVCVWCVVRYASRRSAFLTVYHYVVLEPARKGVDPQSPSGSCGRTSLSGGQRSLQANIFSAIFPFFFVRFAAAAV